jgi:putative sterol carrier protein
MILEENEMKGNSFKLAKDFFLKLNYISEAKKEMGKLDHVIQFILQDGTSFNVEIKDGKVSSVKEGIVEPDIERVLQITSDEDTISTVLTGKLRFADAMASKKLLSADMIKRPALGWAGKLIRIGQGLP